MFRRSFLQTGAAGVIETLSRPLLSAAIPPLALGYDTYSIRSFEMKAMAHLDFAAAHKLDAIQISSLGDFESLDPAHLASVKQRARELNILIDGGTGCICPSARAWRPANGDPVEHLAKAIRAAAAVGARSLRCYLGDSVDRLGPDPIEKHMENTIRVFKANRRLALDSQVKIAIENHSGDLQAWEVKTVIEESGPDAVGACLDTGNPIWCVEDPAVTLEILGALTVTTHVRDTALFEHPRGCAAHWTALGDGSIDLKNLVALHSRLCPSAPMHLEIITGRPPRIVPYLEAGFWKAFPNARASEFARFVALVRRGSPLMKNMVIADGGGKQPVEFRAALKRQQMLDLERSLDYARTVLGVGRAGKS
jgi:sugar phosphate isomerase/epimerase